MRHVATCRFRHVETARHDMMPCHDVGGGHLGTRRLGVHAPGGPNLAAIAGTSWAHQA